MEITVPSGKNVVVGTVYYPPNQNLSLFLHKFNEILFKISKNDKTCFVMGDFNLNTLCLSEHPPTHEFFESLFTHLLFPLINRPMHITAHSAMLIDNIFTDALTHNLFSGIILNDLLITFLLMKSCQANVQIMTVRDFGKSNFTKFQSLLSQASWPDVSVDDDPNNCYEAFLCEFSRLYVSFPQRTRTKSVHSCKMPWITKSLLVSIRK